MPNLDILVTLRCNAKCRNCIEFCNREQDTGLDYSDSDMTLAQIDNFVSQVREAAYKITFEHVYVTGGEPLLHPRIVEIVRRLDPLRAAGYITELHVNSNMTLPVPKQIQKYVVNFTNVKDKAAKHQVVLLHPSEMSKFARGRSRCTHYRKDTWTLSYLGFALCCAGDGYARLYGRGDMFLSHLPLSVREFPAMDEICWNCPFSMEDKLPMESKAGAPVSKIYTTEADKNKAGRKIAVRYPELLKPPRGPQRVTWVCCTFNRHRSLGHLVHCFLQQDYPAELRRLVILDDAGQYENQQGDGWELVSVPRRFATLGQKRNAAWALAGDTDILCGVDDDDMYLPHAMSACVAALTEGEWAIPSAVYQECSPGVYALEPYHGHSSTWGYRREDYMRTTGFSFENKGEDGGLQVQFEELALRIVDPLKLGFEPYCLYGRFQPFHAHKFCPGDYEKLTPGKKQIIEITPGYKATPRGYVSV